MAGKKFVLAGANDANFDRNNELNVSSLLDIIEIKIGIQLAHKIILQNHRQKLLLKNNYHRNGSVFYNVYDPPNSIQNKKNLTLRFKDRSLLWVGRIAPQKRPDLCLQLAKLLPDYQITMVGSRTHHHELSYYIRKEMPKVKNIVYLGHVSLEEVEALFDSVQGLVNTSFVEGFPNTFLQAWSRGLPVFSFVDPDDLIRNQHLGAVVSTIEDMALSVRKLLENKNKFIQNATHIRAFFEEKFSVSKQIQQLEELLLGDN